MVIVVRNGKRKMRSKPKTRTPGRTDGLRELSKPELVTLIDANARKFLGLDPGEFLRLRKQGKPIESPAWGPIDMMASLLD